MRNLQGDRAFIPFRQLGQYEDIETGLYYNRFRYYDPNAGIYISKDPISILGGLNVYAYVKDINAWVDVLGLAGNPILFNSEFWNKVKRISKKTDIIVKGANVFEITKKTKMDGIKKGDLFHLDSFHKNEIELYNSTGKHKGV